MFAKDTSPDSTIPSIALLGGAGTQAQAFLRALDRPGVPVRVLALDRHWGDAPRAAAEELGCTVATSDLEADGQMIRDLVSGASLIVNMAGPFDSAGTVALELAVAVGVNYLDICDDVGATAAMLEFDDAAKSAGTAALLGMGASPGMTNIIVRLALDALGDAPDQTVAIRWVANGREMSDAIFEHVIYSFLEVAGDHDAPSWADLAPETIDFPPPLGRQEVVTMGHPETLTIPRFTRAQDVTNKGGSFPSAYLHVAWPAACAVRAGASMSDVLPAYGLVDEAMRIIDVQGGSGLMVDVMANGSGYRFASGSDTTSVSDATAVAAAGGTLAMLAGDHPGPGVWAPECLEPAAFFRHLSGVSLGGGELKVYEVRDGVVGEPMRLRDLASRAASQPERPAAS
jgi:saccharopine dehydrogenase (NAD+, L-lysine-forming)